MKPSDETPVGPLDPAAFDENMTSDKPEVELPEAEMRPNVPGDFVADPDADDLNQLETGPDHRSGFVAVIGRPNVGKSTLLNRLLGQKIAITSPKPQTTRDSLLGIYTTAAMQIMFVDTPGIHKPQHKLGEHMVSVAEVAIEDADVVLWLVDAATDPTDEDLSIASLLHDIYRRKRLTTPLVVALNKSDMADKAPDAQTGQPARLDAYRVLVQSIPARAYAEGTGQYPVQDAAQGAAGPHLLAISALTGAGVEELLATVAARLPLGPRYYPADQVTDLQTRFIVGELVREKALLLLQQEVPHSLAVVVDEFSPRDDNMTYISAVIYVERASQKGIVLGRQGRTIKEIGQAARPEIEEMVGTRVYLELWVKVWEKWRRREAMLRRLGYAVG
ncbi:MAG: GTPase Era [Litorilinea sp.]